jgi:hypothetical protein
VANILHNAVDKALNQGDYAESDEFARLFPPHSSLTPEDPDTLDGTGHYPARNRSLIYPGEDQGKANRSPVTWDGYVHTRADAFDDDGSDAAVFRAMYGYDAPGGYFDE